MFLQYHGLDIAFTFGDARFRVFNIAREQLNRIIPAHSHGADSYELHYIADGAGQVLIDGTLFEVARGNLYIVGPHVAHAQIPDPRDPQVDECIYFRIVSRDAEDSVAALLSEKPYRLVTDTHGMGALLEDLFDELSSGRVGYTQCVRSLLEQLLVAAARDIAGEAATEKHPFSRATPEDAQAFIIEEAFLYEYPTLTLEALSQRLGLSTRHAERLLQRLYGMSFRSKLAQSRMSAAGILLSYTNQPVQDVAQRLGYATPEHFSTAFRRFYGVSARDYRKSNAASALRNGPVLVPPKGLSSALVDTERGTGEK